MLRRVRVVADDFDVGVEWSALRAAVQQSSGAIAAFCGLVRNQSDQDAATTLTLEHYPGMTEPSIEAILDRAEARWPLDAVWVIHRVGELAPADQIVLVLTASAHRDAAFAACEFVMDYLKTEAVFWKKETRGGISHWVESTNADHQRAVDWQAPAAPSTPSTPEV
jgi:molybdopterin synthase catalytic subunit